MEGEVKDLYATGLVFVIFDCSPSLVQKASLSCHFLPSHPLSSPVELAYFMEEISQA